MSSHKTRESIIELIKRGATEGERAAARAALKRFDKSHPASHVDPDRQNRAEAERRAQADQQSRAEAERRAQADQQSRAEAERRAQENYDRRKRAEEFQRKQNLCARAAEERRAQADQQARAEAERKRIENMPYCHGTPQQRALWQAARENGGFYS